MTRRDIVLKIILSKFLLLISIVVLTISMSGCNKNENNNLDISIKNGHLEEVNVDSKRKDISVKVRVDKKEEDKETINQNLANINSIINSIDTSIYNNLYYYAICDIDNKVNNSIIARKFHNTIIKSTIEMALYIREKTNINTVVISGGVFQNEILFKGVVKGLEQYKFNIATHKIIPCNDSGVSLGQLIIANELVKEELRGESYVYSNSSKD